MDNIQAARPGPARRTSRDVFYAFTDILPSEPDVALVAYAIFERARFEWLERNEREASSKPSRNLGQWIADYDLESAIAGARDLLDFKERMLNRLSVLERIEAELRRIPPASQDYWIGLASGVSANFIFVIIVLICTMIWIGDPSPFGALKTFLGDISRAK